MYQGLPQTTKMFVFEVFKAHHEGWLAYFGGTDKPGEICYNFSYLKQPYSDG